MATIEDQLIDTARRQARAILARDVRDDPAVESAALVMLNFAFARLVARSIQPGADEALQQAVISYALQQTLDNIISEIADGHAGEPLEAVH